MTADLFRKLVLPLSVATVVSLVMAYFFPLQGLFVNLATTFIGILLTVFYVDWILREHEEKRWANVQYRVNDEITKFANLAISEFRTAFHFTTEILDFSTFDSDNPNLIRAEIARIADNILIPAVSAKIVEMDQGDWRSLSANLSSVIQAADRLITLYGERINPDIFSRIVEIREKAHQILAIYFVVPDVLGVPDDQLPVSTKTGESVVDQKQFLNESVARDVQGLLSLASSLLHKL
ncbi:MAG: hypothetical protein JXA78_08880 [Anaerolineales bacterium]|nr:hypothetical protein [Anaerolineales bacterium]